MKKPAFVAFAALALLLVSAWSGQAATPYFPYDTIEDYFKTQPEQPPPPPPSQQPAERPLAEPARKGPVAIAQPPEFLFPAKLGFGVAVGVPYDMMYISDDYYYWQGNVWYRSSSYRGPWAALGYSQLPAELRKHSIATIRELRNSEFSSYWKEKDKYKGRTFRPGLQVKEDQGKGGGNGKGNGGKP
jgi:hypothetical protein